MKMNRNKSVLNVSVLTVAGFLALESCTTTNVKPPVEILPPTPPAYVKVPHPDGMDVGDLLAIFTTENAPAPDSLKDCDADFTKLKEKTQSRDELEQGARELVKLDPVKYHWCFYGKLYSLDVDLKNESYIQEKQKKVTDTYLFITPMSQAFMNEYRDSRYIRIAIHRYRHYSETVFYRKVETTPETTAKLSGVENPWGNYRPSKNPTNQGILEKYGIVKSEDVVPEPKKEGEQAVFPKATTPNAAAQSEAEALPPVAPNGVTTPAIVERTPAAAPVPVTVQPPAAAPAAAPAADSLDDLPQLDSSSSH